MAVNPFGVDVGEIIHNRRIGSALKICRNAVLMGSRYGQHVYVITRNPVNRGTLGLPIHIDQGIAEDHGVIDLICLEIGE